MILDSLLTEQSIAAFKATMTITVGGNMCILLLTFVDLNENILHDMLAFSVGALLGDVFLHLIPHSLEGSDAESIGLYVLSGILSFFIFEKLLRLLHPGNHGHSHEKMKIDISKPWWEILVQPGVVLNMVADASHNFTDGLALAAAFKANETLGFAMVVAITVHEIPHEIGDFAVLVNQGLSKKMALAFQFISAIGAFLGCAVGVVFGESFGGEAVLLAFTAGGFIYVSLVNILPDVLDKSSSLFGICKQGLLFAAGVGFMMFISEIEPHDHDHGHAHEHHHHDGHDHHHG